MENEMETEIIRYYILDSRQHFAEAKADRESFRHPVPSRQGTTIVYRDYMEALEHWVKIGIMEHEMETIGIIRFFSGYIGVILGSYWDNGKENGNYCIMLGLGQVKRS